MKYLPNGEYWINIDNEGPIKVFYDMTTNGGMLGKVLQSNIRKFHVIYKTTICLLSIQHNVSRFWQLGNVLLKVLVKI